MQEVREDAEGEVAACGVAGYGDVGRGEVAVFDEGGNQRDSFAELSWVGSVRGKGVGEHENGDGRVLVREGVAEGEMGGVRG